MQSQYTRTRRRSWRTGEREAIFARDQGKCRYCGVALSKTAYHIDHIVPVIRGGTNDPANLALACRLCNLRKCGDKTRDTGYRLQPIPGHDIEDAVVVYGPHMVAPAQQRPSRRWWQRLLRTVIGAPP